MKETFASVGIFEKRIARHNRYIPGQVVTWSRAENCSRVKRIHRFWDILIFLNHLPQFLTRHLELNFPCACITLELRNALRVMWIFVCGANAPLWCVSPRQGPKNWAISHQWALFPKFGQFRSHARNLSANWNFCKTHSQTQQMHSWTGLDLI